MDTKKLRQKILDLAIRGKLVPQDPNDEPAFVLLERIKAEKERLIKEGKIKRSKKTKTSDTPHYENVPFEVPNNWVWTTVDELCDVVRGGSPRPAGDEKYYNGAIPFLKVADLTKDDEIYVYKAEYTIKEAGLKKTRLVNEGTLLLTNSGATLGVPKITTFSTTFNDGIAAFLYINKEIQLYLYWFLKSKTDSFRKIDQGAAQPNLNTDLIKSIPIPLPPLTEQKRIIKEIKRWFSLINQIDQNKSDLQTIIKQAKSKILDLAIHGKLVPQDPNDEPASELLKRINPSAKITCDNAHYTQLPKGWAICRLEQITDYEQPTDYIVESTDYDTSYSTPVLTAGKSFIIGYTNETTGIYSNLPCIIFDDFTTDSKLVNFPFKVKSSAMKILKVNQNVEIDYVAIFMSITRLIGDTHKRYWISEYSKLEIPIPPQKEQKRIVFAVHSIFAKLDMIMESL